MFIISLDTDWVPQCVFEYVMSILATYRMKSTVFMTGQYRFTENHLIESALHPNFNIGLSHEKSSEYIISDLKSLIPSASGARSHQLYWHNSLNTIYRKHGIQYDSSIFLPFHPGLKPVRINDMVRMPFWWGDGYHMRNGFSMNKFELPGRDVPGMKILNFHPIHIYLNANSIEDYVRMKQAVTDLISADETDLKPFRCNGKGMENLFMAVLDHISRVQEKSFFLKELIDEST